MKVIGLLLSIGLLLVFAEASPYNKYGRTCKDILCIAGQEECVMEQDACTSYSQACGNFPTCKRKAGTAKRGCASVRCDPGHFCSIRQENCSRPPCEIKPMCIAFRTTATAQSSTSVLNKPNNNGYNRGSSSFNNKGGYGGGSTSSGTYGQGGGGSSNTWQRGSSGGWTWGNGR